MIHSDRSSQIDALAPWFHNLHLPGGRQTAPHHQLGDFPAFKWQGLAPHIPADLTGWRALDIGCNAGFYSFELARRGADVLGIDVDDHYLRQARWAAGEFGLADHVEFRKLQIYEMARWEEQFDLVLFMGVFYHLRYPLLGLDIVARRVRRLMVFQTLSMREEAVYDDPGDHDILDRTMFEAAGWPRMAFIERRYAGDPTNWWAPNHACIEAMLRSSGMRVVGTPGEEIYLCEPAAPDAPTRAPYDVTPELRAATGQA